VANNTSSNNPVPNFYRASAADFKKIPGAPIAYWVSEEIRSAYSNNRKIGTLFEVKEGTGTRDDERFLKCFWEVSKDRVQLERSGDHKWVPVDKAGGFRKWTGPTIHLMNWDDDGREVRSFPKSCIRNTDYFFRPAVSWGKVGSGITSFRYRGEEFAFVDAAPSAFGDRLFELLGALNSNSVRYLLTVQGQTLNVTVGLVKGLPLAYPGGVEATVRSCVGLAKRDWDNYRISWDFTDLPLLRPEFRCDTLAATYAALRAHWREMTLEMQRLEEENNRIFIDAYGLQDELTPDVPLEEITLTCNPHYRYSNNKTEEELEALLLADTMEEFISYAVGCIFGRYSLDKPGLILANQGETVEDYLKRIPDPTFMPDADNVIPILDGDWFTDDIVDRFCKFLRVTFGEEHYQENLAFIEKAIGKNVRKYFLKDFYADHVKRYKKRPIYWLFSSPKGSFNALIYMHRYTPDTVSIVLNDYLREFRAKLTGRKEHLKQISISGSASSRDKTAALKEIEKLKTVIAELETYETEILYPLATQRIEIDLDDGVKVNYNKFGNALKKIKGLSKE